MLNPTFTEEHIKNVDTSTKLSRAIDGSLYMPGIVGLNNIKANDYCNVVLQVCLTITVFVKLSNGKFPGPVSRNPVEKLLFARGKLQQNQKTARRLCIPLSPKIRRTHEETVESEEF